MTKKGAILYLEEKMMEAQMNNPFNITFGEEPTNYIPRDAEANQVTTTFNSDSPESKVFILAGPRGCGKTVLLSHIKRIYDKKENWLTVDLNPYGDMVEQMCAKIYERGKIKHLFLKLDFNFSFKGFGFSIQGDTPVSNIESLAEKMFLYLKKKKIKVLITIDDVIKNPQMQYFIHSYQSYIREQYDVYLLMSGLYENISSLENDKGLTFLVRAPKIYLEKLSQVAITNSYMYLLNVDKQTAINLSKTTMGYAYGYQLLGNLLFKNNLKIDNELMAKYDSILEGNVYSLIWKELSNKDKQILLLIAEGNIKNADILAKSGLTNSALQVYKNRLFKAGLIDVTNRGIITLALPRFKEYILLQKEFE